MYNLNALIDRLIEISINNNLIEDMDTVYLEIDFLVYLMKIVILHVKRSLRFLFMKH